MSKKPARRDKIETETPQADSDAMQDPFAEPTDATQGEPSDESQLDDVESSEPQTDDAMTSAEASDADEADVDEEVEGERSQDAEDSLGDSISNRSSLLDEVEAFFHQREALAEKLAQEIEATEARLNELRETMANLYPERAAGTAKDRKPKKPKKAPPRATADSEATDNAQSARK